MRNLLTLFSLVLFVVGLVPAGAGARTADPQDPVLVGRIAHIEGNLLRYIEEDRDWVRTVRDAPFGLEDSLYVENDSRAEFIMPNNTWVRAGEDTQLQLIALHPDATTLDVGLGLARVYNKNPDSIVKVTTPFGAVVATGDTVFDVYVGDESVEVIAIRGTVDFLHEATDRKYEVQEGFASIIADSRSTEPGNGTVDARWDDWNTLRDDYWAKRVDTTSRSAYYLPAPIREEAATLEEYGRWERVSYQGADHELWRPTRIEPDWRPYTAGRWIVYYGDHCWVPDEPFGYVTHHYGSWVYIESARSWYWAPPVVRTVSRTPSLFLSFAWYPGRVGWLYDDRSIGWVPLAPDEPYYGYRSWGRHTNVIVRDRDYRLDLNRYRYLNRAIVVPRDRFYNAPRYTPYVERTVNRTVIVNNYRPTTIINNTVIQNFQTDRGRFSAYAGRVERKPHVSTLKRIHDNQRFSREQERFNRKGIERDLKRMTSATLPTTPKTEVRRQRLSTRMVEASKVDRPIREMSLPQREIKPRERERQIRRDEQKPAGSGREPEQRVRSPREKFMEREARPAEPNRRIAPDRGAADKGREAEGRVRSPREERDNGQRWDRQQREVIDRQTKSDEQRRQQEVQRQRRDSDERKQQEVQQKGQADEQRKQQEVQRQRRDSDQRKQQELQQGRQADEQRNQQEIQRQRRDSDQRKQQELQQGRQADEQRKQQEIQRQRRDSDQRKQQEVQQGRQADEQRNQQEVQRQRRDSDQRKQQEVQQKLQADEQRNQQEVQQKRQVNEQRKQQEVQQKRQADDQRKQQEVQQKRQADEQRKQQEVQQKRQADDQRKQQEVQRQRQVNEQRKQQEVQQKRQADEQRKQQEVQRQRQVNEQRKQQEVQQQRQVNEQRKQQEVQRQRQANEQRKQQEVQQQRQANEQRKQQEVQRQRQANEQRKQQEVQQQRQANEQRKQQEVQRQRQVNEQRKQQEVQRQRQVNEQRKQQEVQQQRQANEQRKQQEVQRQRQANEQRKQQDVQQKLQADEQRKQQAAKKGKQQEQQEQQEEQNRGQGKGRP